MYPVHATSEDKVLDLVNRYRAAQEPHPIVADLLQLSDFERIFMDALQHENFICRQRSQDLAKNEITIMQKAFTLLYQNDATHHGAVALWVEEILGINVIPPAHKSDILTAVVRTKSSLLDRFEEYRAADETDNVASAVRSTVPQGTSDGVLLASQQTKAPKDQMPLLLAKTGKKIHVGDDRREAQLRSVGHDEKFRRLIDIYHKAKTDFLSTPPRSLDRTKAAKFLRDTIENCLAYLEAKRVPTSANGSTADSSSVNGTIDRAMLKELKNTLAQATAIAEKGSGGKKRRFDEDWENAPLEAAKMKARIVPQSSSSNANPVARQGAHADVLDSCQAISQNDHAHPSPVRNRGEQNLPAEYHRTEAANYHQRNCIKPTRLGDRRRSLSPSRLHVAYTRQAPPPGSSSGNPTSTKPHTERNSFSGYGNSDSYRPFYR